MALEIAFKNVNVDLATVETDIQTSNWKSYLPSAKMQYLCKFSFSSSS